MKSNYNNNATIDRYYYYYNMNKQQIMKRNIIMVIYNNIMMMMFFILIIIAVIASSTTTVTAISTSSTSAFVTVQKKYYQKSKIGTTIPSLQFVTRTTTNSIPTSTTISLRQHHHQQQKQWQHHCRQRQQQRLQKNIVLMSSSKDDAITTTTTTEIVNSSSNNSNNNSTITFKDGTTATTIVQVSDTITNNSNNNNNNSNNNPFINWVEQYIGIDEITPEIIAIITIYFVEGALGLARLAQSFLLKDELQLGPAELSALSGIFVLPWTIKPLYGFLSDGFPLFGYQRKSYLILAGILGGISYGILGYSGFWDSLDKGMAISGTVTALLISSACIAFSDVVADGIVVTKIREESKKNNDNSLAGGLQSLCWGAAAIGGLLSAYFSGSLLEIMSVRSIFSITAILPFLVAFIAFNVDEKPIIKNDNNDDNALLDGVKEQITTLWGALKQPSIWKPTLFLFLWQSTPTTDGAFFYFLTNDLELGPEFLGRVRLVTAGAGLLGVWLYNQYFKTVKIKDILYWSTIASFPLGMLPVLLITHINRDLGIPDTALIYGDDVALAALGQISFLPTLVLAARLCPPGVEAVLFATLMSIFNGAGTVGTEIGALLTKWAGITDTNFDNLAWLTVFCNVTSLWPLLLIRWLDEIGNISENDIDQQPNNDDTNTVDIDSKQ